MIAACVDCGDVFHREHDETWRVRCIGCWRARQPDRDVAQYLRERISELERQIRHQQRVIDDLLDDAVGRQCVRIPPRVAEMIPRLVQLCHPDKHANSRASNQVTQELLALRKEVRQ